MMAWHTQRVDRLRQIVAEAITRDKNPRKIGFMDFVLNIGGSLGVSPQTARSYGRTLIQAWNYDKWRSFVENNGYLSERERKEWLDQQPLPKSTTTFRRASNG